ncbi:unnamed protein product [Ambrosiozyma monospora]|uniref:Unnamed protein product n=1 Tax=Ambrosiozyma monospora TaxID=43982 RepID=A0A9W6YSY6_AMBMO|nr:unnamed protein product [Ambrosiozyma monospora]
MNFLKKAVGLTSSTPAEKISAIVPLSEESQECNPQECHNTFASRCFKLDPVDMKSQLWESAKPFDFHVLVSTGSSDWIHDAFTDGPEDGMLQLLNGYEFGKFGKVKLNVSSVGFPDGDDFTDYEDGKKADLLLMPWFVWVKGLDKNNYKTVLDQVLSTLTTKDDGNSSEKLNDWQKIEKEEGSPSQENEHRASKEEHDNFRLPGVIEGAKISKDLSKSYIFLCSHRTRDKRCGVTAPIMKKEFESHLRELDLYRDEGDDRTGGVKVVFTNHVGGHKFAANVMVYNKHGEFVWFAKCSPLNVGPILNETVLKGRVFPELVRTAKKFDPISW